MSYEIWSLVSFNYWFTYYILMDINFINFSTSISTFKKQNKVGWDNIYNEPRRGWVLDIFSHLILSIISIGIHCISIFQIRKLGLQYVNLSILIVIKKELHLETKPKTFWPYDRCLLHMYIKLLRKLLDRHMNFELMHMRLPLLEVYNKLGRTLSQNYIV